MVTYRWNNELQRNIVEEWTEGCQKARGLQDLRNLRKQLAEKYGLNMSIIEGIVEQGATEGIVQRPYPYGKKYVAVNYHEVMGDFEQRLKNVERKLNFALDGMQNVIEDGEMMAIKLNHLRKMGKWMKKRDTFDVEEIRSTPLNENKGPPLLELGEADCLSEEFMEPQKEIEEVKIKTEPLTTDRTKEMEKLRAQIDRARDRVDSHKTKKPPPRLLFQGIEEGKKALPR